MRWIIGRPRGQHGQLIRQSEELPPWVEVDERGMRTVRNPIPFEVMFRRVRRFQGLDPVRITESWKKYRKDNPKLGAVGEP